MHCLWSGHADGVLVDIAKHFLVAKQLSILVHESFPPPGSVKRKIKQ
jgi:hypothetical protein